MKIVFLAPFGIRPKGTVIARMIPLAAELQGLGHEVVILAPPYTNPEDSGKTEVLSGVRLCNIVLGPKNRVIAAPLLAWRMFCATLAEKPDLVQLFKPKGYGGLAAMLHLSLQIIGLRLPPLLLDTDDWEGSGGMNESNSYSAVEKRFYRFQEQWLIKRVAGISVASRALEEMVAAMGVAGSRILYLPNCAGKPVRASGAGVKRRLGIESDAPVLLLYSRFFEFSQEKLHFLFAEIYRQIPQVRFLVVGKGRSGEEDQLLAAGREMGFATALLMAGWIDPAEIPDYLAAGDVAVYPFADTLVNRTKCPAKLTELLIAELAVVADSIGQIPEYIVHEYSGILCDHNNWQEMADRAVELLQDPARRYAMGLAGREYLLENFSWRQYAEQLNDFYKRFSAGS